MGHTCAGAIVRCMDFRLESEIEKYLDSTHLCNHADVISVAGAAKSIAEEDNGFVEGQVDLSKQLHAINKLVLMNHTDCGGYGGRDAFSSVEEERATHERDLKAAKAKIAAKYPDLEIKTTLAVVGEDNQVAIEEIV